MPAAILDDLKQSTTQATTVMSSASTFIRGFSDRLAVAVTAALANGATAAELAPIQAEIDGLDAQAQDLTLAIVENTPATAERRS